MSEAVGYVTDIPYVAGFVPELSPDWLDLVSAICGVARARSGGTFTWCELGCGRGLTAAVYAAMFPQASCVGIDLLPEHVAFAERLSAAAGVGNVNYHALPFSAAVNLDIPPQDYIVAHGVYSWIGGPELDAFHRFIDRHLAPGGRVYVSYNAMPGWAGDAPFQHLARALADQETGDSAARFSAAATVVQRIASTGAPALTVATNWIRHLAGGAPAYLVHEYMARHWRAIYVDDMRATMAQLGLTPAGSATIEENFDTFMLTRNQRSALATIAEGTDRELARDYVINQRFRRDVFVRSPQYLSSDERRAHLLGLRFALLTPPSLVEFMLATSTGRVPFDTPMARRLVAELADGPKRLIDCLEPGEDGRALLANALIMCGARVLWPATREPIGVTALNDALFSAADLGAPVVHQALAHGTAVRFDRSFVADMRNNADLVGPPAAWATHLRAATRA